MFLRTIFVLAAAALGALGASTSVNVDKNATVVIDTKETEFGTLVFYGRADQGASSLKPRQDPECGPPDVRCLPIPSRTPDVQACQLLIAALKALPDSPISNGTDAVCASVGPFHDRAECCVTWERRVPGLQTGDLVPAAEIIFDRCVSGGGQAGDARQINLRGVCTRECLSNSSLDCIILPPVPPA